MNQKILITLIFAILSTCGYSQSKTEGFVYELTYTADATNLEEQKSTQMILMTDGRESVFKGYNNFILDTLTSYHEKIGKDPQVFFGNPLPVKPSTFRFQVHKQGKTIDVYDNLAFDAYVYTLSEVERPVWKIVNEHQTIGGLNVQKAITSYAGRDYIAWFAEEIPYNDGPFVFAGLPGLIVKISDADEHYIFELLSTIKLTQRETKPKVAKKPIRVTRDQFVKIRMDYHQNPVQKIEMAGNSAMLDSHTKNRVTEQKGKNTNFIEKYP